MKCYRSIISFLGLILLGCGLADYEARMAEEQERVRIVEEQNKYLDDPVEIPAPKKENEKDPKPPDFFFRPPKGIGRTANKDLYGGKLYTYPRTGNSEGFIEVYVGFSQGKADFLKNVLKVFPGPAKNSETQRVPFERQPLQFQTVTIDDPNSTVYLHSMPAGDQTLVLAFRTDHKADPTQVANRMNLSLDTVAVGAEAGRVRKEYRQRAAFTRAVPKGP